MGWSCQCGAESTLGSQFRTVRHSPTRSMGTRSAGQGKGSALSQHLRRKRTLPATVAREVVSQPLEFPAALVSVA